MTLSLTWSEIALRLALTVAVGIVIGYNRSEHGKVAGMSTSVLVCLAASVAMIQVNVLLPTSGRPPGSFVMNDLMRLPLGILTGVGFIGAGAIMRRDNLVIGVTTAATLWLLTVVGLCLGGGQIALGLVAALLGLSALWGLKSVECLLNLEHRANLTLELGADVPGEDAIRERLAARGFTVTGVRTQLRKEAERRHLTFELHYFRRSKPVETPQIIRELAAENGVLALEWQSFS